MSETTGMIEEFEKAVEAAALPNYFRPTIKDVLVSVALDDARLLRALTAMTHDVEREAAANTAALAPAYRNVRMFERARDVRPSTLARARRECDRIVSRRLALQALLSVIGRMAEGPLTRLENAHAHLTADLVASGEAIQ